MIERHQAERLDAVIGMVGCWFVIEQDEPVDPNNTIVFVGGLRDGADPERLTKAFSPFG